MPTVLTGSQALRLSGDKATWSYLQKRLKYWRMKEKEKQLEQSKDVRQATSKPKR